MGMDVHVGLRLIHTAERSRAGIEPLLGNAVLRFQLLSPQIGGLWRTSGFQDRRGTGQT